MIVHIPKQNAVIASSNYPDDTYYLYRDNGEEVTVVIEENKIKSSSHLLNFTEIEYIRNYIINKQVNGNRFLQFESKM